MKLDEAIQNIQNIIDELKVSGAQNSYAEGVAQPLAQPKALYESAYEALQRYGRPAKVKDLLPEMRILTKRARLSPQLAYQALEYNRKHKKRVSRKNGLWTVKGH
jgi:hypothetical protein